MGGVALVVLFFVLLCITFTHSYKTVASTTLPQVPTVFLVSSSGTTAFTGYGSTINAYTASQAAGTWSINNLAPTSFSGYTIVSGARLGTGVVMSATLDAEPIRSSKLFYATTTATESLMDTTSTCNFTGSFPMCSTTISSVSRTFMAVSRICSVGGSNEIAIYEITVLSGIPVATPKAFSTTNDVPTAMVCANSAAFIATGSSNTYRVLLSFNTIIPTPNQPTNLAGGIDWFNKPLFKNPDSTFMYDINNQADSTVPNFDVGATHTAYSLGLFLTGSTLSRTLDSGTTTAELTLGGGTLKSVAVGSSGVPIGFVVTTEPKLLLLDPIEYATTELNGTPASATVTAGVDMTLNYRAKDSLGNYRAFNDAPEVQFTGPETKSFTPTWDGTKYTAHANLTKAGSYTMKMGTTTTGSRIINAAAELSTSQSNITPPEVSETAGQNYTVYVTAKDTYGNIITTNIVNQITYSTNTSDTALQGAPVDLNNGTVKYTYKTNKRGGYLMHLQHNGIEIDSGPFEFAVVSAAANFAASTVSSLSTLLAGQTFTGMIVVRDVYNNVRDQAKLSESTTTDTSVSVTPALSLGLTALSNGSVQFVLTGTVAQSYEMNTVIASQTKKVAFSVLPAAADVIKSNVSSVDTSVTVGTTSKFNITVVDTFMNSVTQSVLSSTTSTSVTIVADAGVTVSVAVTVPNIVVVSVTTNSAKAYNVAVRIGGTLKQTYTITFNPAVVNATTSSFSITKSFIAGTTYSALLTAKDGYGNTVPQTAVNTEFQVAITPSTGATINLSYNTAINISVSANYTGKYNFSMTIGGSQMFYTATITVAPDILSPIESSVTLPTNGTVNVPYTVIITARDRFRNLIPNPMSLVTASFSPQIVESSRANGVPASGTFRINYYTTVSTLYPDLYYLYLARTAPLEDFSNSPYAFTIAPSTPKSKKIELPEQTHVVGNVYTLYATALDGFNNVIPQAKTGDTNSSNFEVSSTPSMQFTLSIVNSSLAVQYYAEKTDDYTLVIKFLDNNGGLMEMFSEVITMHPGITVCAKSTVDFNYNFVGIAGERNQLQVVVKDQFENLVYGDSASNFTTTFTPTISYVVDNPNTGVFVVDYSTIISGDYTGVVACRSADSQDFTRPITINPVEPTMANSLFGIPDDGTAGLNYTLTFTAKDKFDNIVPQSAVDGSHSTDFTIEFIPSINYTLTIQNKSVVITYWATTSQAYSMYVYLQEKIVTGFPVSFSIISSDVDPRRCIADGKLREGNAPVNQPIQLQVTSFDAFGNRVYIGGSVFKMNISTPNGTAMLIAVDLQNGLYEFTYMPLVAGVHGFSVYGNGVPIANNTFSAVFTLVPIRIEPQVGPMSGDTAISFVAAGVYDTHTITCRFGSVVATAQYGAGIINCTVPSATFVIPGMQVDSTYDIPVSVSLDGVTYSSPLLFTYYVNPTVNNIYPRSSLSSAESKIQVFGTGFLNYTSVACVFGDIAVPAVYVSPTLMTCTSPLVPILQSKKRADLSTLTVPLEVTLNGQQTTTNAVEFIFFLSPRVLSISPALGPITGGTNVSVQLDYVPVCGDVMVIWRPLGVSLLILNCTQGANATIIFGVPPSTNTGTPEVSINGQQWITTNLTYTYYDPISTVRSCPSSGPNSGNIEVVIFGDNFIVDSPNPQCRVELPEGSAVFSASVVSSQLVYCYISHALPSGTAKITVSNNAQDFSGNTTFSLFGDPKFVKILTPNGNYSDNSNVLGQMPVISIVDANNATVKDITLSKIRVQYRLANTNNLWETISPADGGSASLDKDGNPSFTMLKFTNKIRGGIYEISYKYGDELDDPSVISNVTITVAPCASNEQVQIGNPSQCDCNPGYYLADKSCVPCGNGNFTSIAGSKTCSQCRNNMDTAGKIASISESACVCAKDYYAQVTSTGISQCLSCPFGASCAGNTSIIAKDGFWRSPNTYEFFECNDPSACQNQTCVRGSIGPLCGACRSGYALVGSKCSVCPNLGLTWFLFLITALVVFFAVIILIWRNVLGERSERTIILKILINYLQTLSFIGGFGVWNFSKGINSLFQVSSSSNFSVGIFTIHCAVQWSQYDKFLFYMVAPLFGLLIIVIFFFLRHIVYKRKQLRDFFTGLGWSYAKTTMLVFLLLIHPTLTQQIFQMFNCTDFAGNKYLAVDLSISCDTHKYKQYSSAAIAMIFVYVLGIPVLIAYQLGVNRKRLNEPEVRAKLRFLYEGYTLFFWEIIIIVRKILLVALVVFLRDDNFRAVWAGIWLLCIALFANVWARPYQRASLQLLESASLSTLLATLMFGFLTLAPNFSKKEGEQTLVTFFAFFLNCVMTLILVVSLAYQYYKHLAQNKYFQNIVYKIIKIIKYTQGLRSGETTDDLNFELEMDTLGDFTDEKYNVRTTEPITAEKLRRGRSDFRLTLAETPIGDRDTGDDDEDPDMEPSMAHVRSTDNMLPPQ